ncbi:MAG: hybrid sensor histidine kinase/response regulator [Anaerolineae bacterium]
MNTIGEARPKVLAVDDRVDNLRVLSRLLKQLDLDTLRATSGEEALALAEDHDFFLAIVDVLMPEMDGYELVERLRSRERTATLPVIFVTAVYSDAHYHRKGYDAGAVDFLTKPFSGEVLLSKVKVFLELYRQRQHLAAVVEELHATNRQLSQLTRELEDRVRVRTAELELLDRNKSEFIQIISHELRTPLTLIKGFSQMLLENPCLCAEQQCWTYLEGIAHGADRAHEILNSMLDMVRIDSNSLPLKLEWVALPDLLVPLCEDLGEPMKARHLKFTEEWSPHLPRIYVDPDEISKVFRHLLYNAVKYTPDGGEVSVSARPVPLREDDDAGDFVEIVVSDTGIGIDPRVQEVIFTKFYQVEPLAFHSSGKTKFKGGGAGLGLAIARGIVEAHGGRIWVESPGCDEERCPGSRFRVMLPVKRRIASQEEMAARIEAMRGD